MSQTILPNSERAIPKTNAERTAADPQMEQAPGGIRIQLEDPEDPPGEEMSKNARVWKTYVREADRWDKEMVDGRNSSLDVLLIFVSTFRPLSPPFAALFSAISTAFIIESLGDLKPDPAERSANSLLAISQKLDFIVAGQQNTSPMILDSGLDTFAPSYSAVVVNILWLLSLSLSVAVSLIAMLAKEWCYKFMTGRSGPIYNQARRRQQKWDGIEKWKMQEMLSYLPGLMHSALLLFAVGLCIYLWNINISVAIPVTVVTAIAGCIYTSTTLLPLFDRFCPYSTPATLIVNLWPCITYQVVDYAYSREYYFGWLISLRAYLAKFVPNPNNSDEDKDNTFAHMDIITSRMLAWMIVNCEDSRSVDVALQAVSAAQTAMPLTPLKECDAISRIDGNINALIEWKSESNRYIIRDKNTMRTALRYCRAGSVLMRGIMLTDWVPDWQIYNLVERHISLFEQLNRSATYNDRSEIAVNTTAYLHHVCLDWDSFHKESSGFDALPFRAVATLVNSALEDHTKHNSSTSSTAALVSLLEACAYYMIKCWPTELDSNKSQTLTLLLRIFLNQGRNTDVARIIAYALASAAFAVKWHPGGEQPSQPAQDLRKRAVQVMRSYQMNPDHYSEEGVFTFGFIALFSYVDMNELRSHSDELLSLQSITHYAVSWGHNLPPTIPASYTWTSHIHAASQNLQPQITETPEILGAPSRSIALYLLFLRAGLSDHGLLVPVLAIFRHAKSQELQDMCIKALVDIPIATSWSKMSTMLDYWDVLPALFNTSHVMDGYISAVFIFYFRLLVANMMLCNDTELLNRQNTLRSKLFHVEGFQALKPTSEDHILPPLDRILDYLAEHTDGMPVSECMLRTMQLVADFCHADPSKYHYMQPGPQDVEEVPEWVTKLQAIKDNFKPSRADVQRLEVAINKAQAEEVNDVVASIAETGIVDGGDPAEGSLGRERVRT
ncbi:hypothetical protein RhiJN_22437 [Ceratobasidium sp. AG-Ba]|nr:hypothetical protein RhiJN_22437 [Ceratobasidium sp. AG-Ba]